MKSEYLDKFKKLQQLQDEGKLTLGAGLAFIEKVEREEIKTASGIVFASAGKDYRASETDLLRSDVSLILMVGAGSDETYKPGQIALLPNISVRWYSTFPGLGGYTEGKIGLIALSEINMIYESAEAFEEASRRLNSVE